MSETAAPEPTNTKKQEDEKQTSSASCTAHPLFQNTPSSVEFTKLRKRLIKQMRQTIDDFDMLGLNAKPVDGTKPNPSKKWLVCVSGGKDSYGLISLLHDLKWRGLLPVELIAMNLDQKQPGFPSHILPEFFKQYDIPNHIETQDTYTIVTGKVPANKTYCSLCSRLRRGIIYTVAKKLGCDTVVLGHHREDILETFLLNLFFGAKLSAMPPKLLNEEGTLNLIRPLSYVAENDLSKFSNYMNFPIIPCDLCGSQDGLQRQQMKKLLTSWEEQRPGTKEMMLKSLGNIRPSQLLDQKLFDFSDLSPKLPENS